MSTPTFVFDFYRFVGSNGNRTTEMVRDYTQADGMRGLVDRDPKQVQLARERVEAWAASKGISISAQEPFPSEKYPGKVWLEYRFGGLSL